MMTHLVKNPTASERDFYVRYLYDQDSQIAAVSTKALEKITSVRFTAQNDKDLIKQWQKAAKQQKIYNEMYYRNMLIDCLSINRTRFYPAMARRQNA